MKQTYEEFLHAKTVLAQGSGLSCEQSEIHPWLKPFSKDIVQWAVKGGCRAIFSAFGLHKTVTQLEIVRLVLAKSGGGVGIIVCPLGVRQEFFRDAEKVGTKITFVRRTEEIIMDGIYLTNYESVRDGKLDPRKAACISLDEASILRGFGGTKTFREFMAMFEGSSIFRYVATATPSPNEFIELLAYAAFLGVMDVGQAKTRFFKRDSTKADKLTLHPHKEKEFWLWMSSWAIFLQKPSDLGYDDFGYEFPPLDVRWHELPSDHSNAGIEKDGQHRMFKNAAIGVSVAAREKRSSLDIRINKLMELRAEDPSAHRLIWHDLEDEREAIEEAIPDVTSVYGKQKDDAKEKAMMDFADGTSSELAAKPVMCGSGVNWQRHCAWEIFLGVGYKFNDFLQSIHRVLRFGQTKQVRLDIIYTEAEREIRAALERKWENHKVLVAEMSRIIREYGLAGEALKAALGRTLGCERQEESGPDWKMVNNDSVVETKTMLTASVDLILTSIPFATQYEYSPSYNDFGHTDDMDHFFEQMDFLTPNLFRVLKPGRVMAIHVKDRNVPGGMTGLGFQTVDPFHAKCIDHYTTCPDCRIKKLKEMIDDREHGKKTRKVFRCTHRFAYLGMKTIATDVVRENTQTYRLGWTEQCKDGSRMGVGMPEYLLLFRKPPTDASNGYADVPVVKDKREWIEPECDPETGVEIAPGHWSNDGYSRARWQFDAHGFMRSSGQRLLHASDLAGCTHAEIFKLFKRHSLGQVYDFEHDVKLAEEVDRKGMLPPSFMLLQPQSSNPDVWTDITRMRTLNMIQEKKGKEFHLCPIQEDLVKRVVNQFTMAGETVYDPFAGLGSVPLYSLRLGRRGIGCELAPGYYTDACYHLRCAQQARSQPTLFELEAILGESVT